MPLILARRGRCIFRQLNLRETLPISARISLIPSHVRRVAQTAYNRPSHLITAASSSKITVPRVQANSYATSAGRPKAHTGKAKAKKSSSPKSKSKSVKKTASKAKTAKEKKELTPEAKARKEAKERKAEIRELKELVLKEPKGLPTTGFIVYVGEKLREAKLGGKDAMRDIVSEYRSRTPDELEPYHRQAEANKAANAAAYESWVKSYTPLQIRQANLARKRLSKLTESSARPIKMSPIKDDRQVKGIHNSFNIYYQERFNSGDLKHMSITDATQRIAEEWKGLTDQEKERYNKLSGEDSERYIQEYRTAYGEDPAMVNRKSASP